MCSSEVVVADYIRVFTIHDAAGSTAQSEFQVRKALTNGQVGLK